MKLKIKKCLLVVLTCALTFALSSSLYGCLVISETSSNGNSTNSSIEALPELTLNEEELNLNVGDSYTLIANVTNWEGDIVWTSSAPQIVSVINGVLTANEKGEATVTATLEGKGISDSVKVTVSERYVPTLSLTATALTLNVGETYQIIPTILYGDESVTPDDGFAYESRNSEVASVNEQGLITVISSGEAVITISAEYQGVAVNGEITVMGKNLLLASLTSLSEEKQIELSAKEGEHHVAELLFTALYNDTTVTNPEAEGVSWTVADHNVVTLEIKEGKVFVIGQKFGNTTITVVYTVDGESVRDSVEISVYNPVLASEINSFVDGTRLSGVTATVSGLNAYSTASSSYYVDGKIGERAPYGDGFLKATHIVPDSSVEDAGSRGENLEVNIASLNTLQALKDAGYTKIIIPMYLHAHFDGEATRDFWYVLGNGGWAKTMELKANTWQNFEYDLDTAISDFGATDTVKICIANYSADYTNGMNVNIDVYFDGIFAVRENALVEVQYDGEKLDGLRIKKDETFDVGKLSVIGLLDGMGYIAYLTTPDGTKSVLTENFALDTNGNYCITILPECADDGKYYLTTASFIVYTNVITVLEDEVNSLATEDHFNNRVTALVSGLNAYSTASVEYYDGIVGEVEGKFVKATHIVPDATVSDPGSRGENLEINVASLNTLQALKDAGYTQIVIPMYLQAHFDGEATRDFWYVLGNGGWAKTMQLEANTWQNFVYDIDTAISDFGATNTLKICVANYSADYTSGMNVNIDVYVGAIYATGKTVELVPAKNEVNSLQTQEHYNNRVTALVSGLNAYSTASVEYYDGTVGEVEGKFVKATHIVPDATVSDPGSRGENLEINVVSLNTLQALKDAGYTQIVIPMYLQAHFDGEATRAFWYVLGNGGWAKTMQLKANTWQNFVYDIDTAISDFGATNTLKICVANYSADYTSGMNVNIDVYVGAIYATVS